MMLFNSWQFLLFFPIVTTLYFVIGRRFQWLLLLIASCVFYMAFIPAYILILAFTIGIDYVAGLLIEGQQGERRKIFLVISLLANLGLLGFFKYFNFFNGNVAALATLLHWNYPIQALAIALPIGLSFHVFQSMSYTIEVYRGNQKAERHFGIYALYVMFYPQLVAGPIERPQNLLHQFRARHGFEAARVADGLKLMLWGLFKKVVIADRLASVVNPVFAHPQDHTGLPLVIACFFFAFQIYCDFSGYSDIAIGAAQVMGFKLMTNFRRPYFARSLPEFWTRWHISLSTWFRDYLYIPLGGNRVSRPRHLLNLLVVFLVSGLWHGASWTFVVWGALHGVGMALVVVTRPLRERFARWSRLDRLPVLAASMGAATTFTFVCVAWIFFRAASLSDAWYIVTHLGVGLSEQLASIGSLVAALDRLGPLRTNMVLPLALLTLLTVIHALQERGSIRARLALQPIWVRFVLIEAAIWGLLFLGVYENYAFIYFQF